MSARKSLRLGLAALALGGGLVLASESTASAAPLPHSATIQALMGGNGRCYTNWHTSKAVNMWCDGKGPERYGVSAVCTSGTHTYQYNSSDHPWFGDHRGATVTCKKGNLTTWWGYPAN